MRIGPFDLGFRRPLAAAEPTAAPHKPAGASGTINLHGFLVPDEYNDELRFPHSLKIYQRMLRGDAAVREAFMHTAAPIVNATWDIDPASDEPQDLEIAEMVRRAYFEWCESPFTATMALTAHYLAQGFQLFELTEQVVEEQLVYTKPDTNEQVTVPSRQFVTWKRWEHRRAETIYKWDVEDGELVDVVQLAFKGDAWGEWTIPAENTALFVCDQEGDDFAGVPVLRSAYKAWWMKELIEKVMAMSVERHGLGINVAYTPDDARNDEALIGRAEDMLASLRAGDANYLVWPGPKQQAAASGAGGANGYLFEIVTPTGGLPDFTKALTYLRGDIKGAVLARFSELGHGSVGARATSNTQAEIWYASLHARADYIASVHNQKIRQLVDKNYADVDCYPKLVPRNIEAKSLLEFAQANAALVAAGAISPDKSYRQFVRDEIDAPDEDETSDVVDPTTEAETEPEDGIVPPGEAAQRLAQQQRQQTEQIAARLEKLAADVVGARRKDERSELADLIGGVVAAVKALPAPVVNIDPTYQAHEHRHEHQVHEHHRHEGLSADELRALFEEISDARRPAVAASQKIERDGEGRLVSVREFDAAGGLVRSRRVTAWNDDGTVKTIIEED